MRPFPDPPPPAQTGLVRRQWPGHDGNVLSRGSILLLAPVALLPVWLPIAQLAAGLVIVELIPGTASGDPVLWLVLGTPAVTFAAGLLYQWWYIDYLPSRYFLWRMRREVRTRPDPVVDPDDPAAVFIQVVPRDNWKVMLENASDVGFLAIDEDRRLILFEGDSERWVIPAACVRSITIEDFCPTTIDRLLRNLFPMVVLGAEARGKGWEACVAPRQVRFERWGPDRRRAEVEAFGEWLRSAIEGPGHLRVSR